jgi:hypothetical protein
VSLFTTVFLKVFKSIEKSFEVFCKAKAFIYFLHKSLFNSTQAFKIDRYIMLNLSYLATLPANKINMCNTIQAQLQLLRERITL